MHHDSLTAVLNASKNWIKHFNHGDVNYCVSAYAESALLEASPIGAYNGRRNIDDFWRPFLQSGACDLSYSNIWLREIDENTVHLGADWKMNVCRGTVILEEWVKTESGTWKLLLDQFEIQERF